MDSLQVIAEPRRRAILELVWSRELTAGEIASHFDVTFGAISQHLATLRTAGLVEVRADGRRRLYRADPSQLGPLRQLLETMWAAKLDALAEAAQTGLAT